jgi:hypothetical protein
MTIKVTQLLLVKIWIPTIDAKSRISKLKMKDLLVQHAQNVLTEKVKFQWFQLLYETQMIRLVNVKNTVE